MIFFPELLLERITNAAETTFPDECCGLLLGHWLTGDDLIVSRVEASDNLTRGARCDSFEVDAKLRFDLMRELAGSPERIIGHYHSHPNGRFEPSDRDLEMAWEPELVWLITSVVDGLATRTTGWLRNQAGNGFIEVSVGTSNEKQA